MVRQLRKVKIQTGKKRLAICSSTASYVTSRERYGKTKASRQDHDKTLACFCFSALRALLIKEYMFAL
jgi:hypothetical protein